MSEKICVVVGAGPGVGLAVARRFGREGYKLALIARNEATLAGYTADLTQQGLVAQGFAADAGNLDSVRAAFEKIKSELGDPTVLVYNAAALAQGRPTEVTPEKLLSEFTVNVAAALAAAQAVIPAMRQIKSGTILFTGGGLALNPAAPYASLSIGKAGIRSLALSLAGEVGNDGIHVATVTIGGFVQPGTHFDPDKIAETYWQLHSQPSGQWETEIVYR